MAVLRRGLLIAYLLAIATSLAANIMLFRDDLHIHAGFAASAALMFTVYCFYAARSVPDVGERIRSSWMSKAKGLSLASITIYALGMAFVGDDSGLSVGFAFRIAAALALTPLFCTDALLVFGERRENSP